MRRKKVQAEIEEITPIKDIKEHISIEEYPSVMDTSYMRYTFSVIKSRAIPDAKDGLKPSQRRVLVAMNDLHLSPSAQHIKSAKIAGTCSGDYHPHGEAIVYPTMVRLTQDWIMRYPLIDGQGNWGNIGGSSAAAMRYTEARLSPYGSTLLYDLSEDVVPYVPNYDDKLREPSVLPSLMPNLLVNGAAGIAVGVATKIPSHNLREIANLIAAYIENKNLTTDEIMAIMPGPDFPTGGVLRGQTGVRNYYETGRGSLTIDGVYEIETNAKGNQQIVVTELPYGGSDNKLDEEVHELAKEGKLVGVVDCENFTSRKRDSMKVRVVIYIGKNGNAQLILNQLFKSTCLRANFDVNNTVIHENKVLENTPLLKLVEIFVDHRKTVIINRLKAEEAKSRAKVHELRGLISVSLRIDEAIKIIRASDDPEDATAKLIAAQIAADDIQAKAILALTLSRLTKLATVALESELNSLSARIEEIVKLLADERKILKMVAKEQLDLAKKMGDDRRTKIGNNVSNISTEDVISEEKLIISLTKDGYIKRLPINTYRLQNRGGKGVIGVGGKKETDETSELFVASTHDQVLFFTNTGLVYRKRGHEIPLGTRISKGTHLANLLALNADECVTKTMSLPSLDVDGYIVMVTKNGLIKRSKIRDYDTHLKTKGLQSIKLNDGDELSFVAVTDGSQDIFLATSRGKAIRYSEKSVMPHGRVSAGMKAMKLLHGDTIAKMIVIDVADNPDLLVVTTAGFGKRSNALLYRCFQGRYAQGITTIDLRTNRNGAIADVVAVSDTDTLLILTTKGKVIQIPVSSIRSMQRAAMGVRVVKLDDGDSVKAMATKDKDELQLPEDEES